jgi:hypothetical protein
VAGAAVSPAAKPPGAGGSKRLVEGRVRAAREVLRGLGVEADVHVGWSLDRRALIVRCWVLGAGAEPQEGRPPARAHGAAAFCSGYLLRDLADLGVRPQYKATLYNLLVPLPA